jgi:hypothetical protein
MSSRAAKYKVTSNKCSWYRHRRLKSSSSAGHFVTARLFAERERSVYVDRPMSSPSPTRCSLNGPQCLAVPSWRAACSVQPVTYGSLSAVPIMFCSDWASVARFVPTHCRYLSVILAIYSSYCKLLDSTMLCSCPYWYFGWFLIPPKVGFCIIYEKFNTSLALLLLLLLTTTDTATAASVAICLSVLQTHFCYICDSKLCTPACFPNLATDHSIQTQSAVLKTNLKLLGSYMFRSCKAKGKR